MKLYNIDWETCARKPDGNCAGAGHDVIEAETSEQALMLADEKHGIGQCRLRVNGCAFWGKIRHVATGHVFDALIRGANIGGIHTADGARYYDGMKYEIVYEDEAK
jgi:hypothetical protein